MKPLCESQPAQNVVVQPAWHRGMRGSGTWWHCLGIARMHRVALAVGLSTEPWLHHSAPLGDFFAQFREFLPPWHPGSCATCRSLLRNRKLPQGYFSLCGSACSAFCHVAASVPKPPGSSWQATDPLSHEQDVPCLHPNFPIGATSLGRAAVLGTPSPSSPPAGMALDVTQPP